MLSTYGLQLAWGMDTFLDATLRLPSKVLVRPPITIEIEKTIKTLQETHTRLSINMEGFKQLVALVEKLAWFPHL